MIQTVLRSYIKTLKLRGLLSPKICIYKIIPVNYRSCKVLWNHSNITVIQIFFFQKHSDCSIKYETVSVVKQVPSFSKHCHKVEDTKCKTIFKNSFTTKMETQCVASFDTRLNTFFYFQWYEPVKHFLISLLLLFVLLLLLPPFWTLIPFLWLKSQ